MAGLWGKTPGTFAFNLDIDNQRKQKKFSLFDPATTPFAGIMTRANDALTSWQAAGSPITGTKEPEEPELTLDDPNATGGTGMSNILLRRRRLQNAMKYGFASTVKHTSPAGPRSKSPLQGSAWFLPVTSGGVVGA